MTYKGDYTKGEIEIIETANVFQNEFVSVFNDNVIFPSGYKGTYLRMLPSNKYSVAVLPITLDGKIVLIKNFRHGMRGWCYEIPKGGAENGESEIQTACRELGEETGYNCERLELLGEYSESPSVFGSAIKCFLAFGCYKEGKEHSEKTEAINGVVEVGIDEFFSIQTELDFLDAISELLVLKYIRKYGGVYEK